MHQNNAHNINRNHLGRIKLLSKTRRKLYKFRAINNTNYRSKPKTFASIMKTADSARKFPDVPNKPIKTKQPNKSQTIQFFSVISFQVLTGTGIPVPRVYGNRVTSGSNERKSRATIHQ